MQRKIRFLFLLLLPTLLNACDDENAAQNGAPAVTVSAAKRERLTEWDEYTGRFRAVDRVEIRARVSGYLDEIRFTDGQMVEKDDVLFVIDQRPFAQDLAIAQSRYDLAQVEYERSRKLRANNNASQQTLDQRYQLLREAKALLEQAKLNMEFTEVKSPIKGRVSRHLIDEGNLISGGDVNATLLTVVVSLDPLHFYFDASEQELLKYIALEQDGKRASSRDEARAVYVKLQNEQDYKHLGRMDFVDNELDRSSGTISGRALFDNPDASLIPGLFGRLRIAGSAEYEAMLVPDEAVASNQTQKIVYVVNAENKVEPRPVVLGPLHKEKWRIVREGLKAEDNVVWTGLAKIRPGMAVTPTPLETPAAADEAATMDARE